MDGWILLWRKVRTLSDYRDKPFNEWAAWIDMILEANFADRVDRYGEEIPRGCFHTSQPALAKRWGWSRAKVRRYLDRLEADQRIGQETTKKRTRIRITKFEEYQTLSEIPAKEPAKRGSETGQATGHNIKKDPIKKDKKERVSAVALPPHLSNSQTEILWTRYHEIRKAKGKPFKTEEAQHELLKQFRDAEHFQKTLSHSVANEYQGLFPEKFTTNGSTPIGRPMSVVDRNAEFFARRRRERESN